MGSEHRRAWEDYQANLQRLRDLAPVTTICMHGSPLSRINNLDLWQTYDYKELGIVGDPYLDVDFSQVFYITDTGRRWNHETSSVRDRVGYEDLGIEELRNLGIEELMRCHSTKEIIAAVETGKSPDKVMFNVHPQRWHDRPWPWVKELVGQNVKNVAKKVIIKFRD